MSHSTFTINVPSTEVPSNDYEEVTISDKDDEQENTQQNVESELTMEAYYSYRLQPGFHYPTSRELKEMDVADLMQFIATAEAIDNKSISLTIAESKARDVLKKKQPSGGQFFDMFHGQRTGPASGVLESSSRIPEQLHELQRSIRPLNPAAEINKYVKDTVLDEIEEGEAHEQEEFEKFGTMDTLAAANNMSSMLARGF